MTFLQHANNTEKSIHRIFDAIERIRQGQMVIMVDDEDRENEGDIVFAAEHVSPEKINFMAKEARGLICLAMAPQLIDRLELPLMSDVISATRPGSPVKTAFTVSIEARHGVSTGISAFDRSHTVKTAISDQTSPSDIVIPGHIFPLKARPGGVLERTGHTEGSVDLARLAGLKPASVICEIMCEDGSMARGKDLEVFAKRHNLPIISIADLIQFRLLKDSLVKIEDETTVQLFSQSIRAYLFRSVLDHELHFALVRGNPSEGISHVRVHHQSPILDSFAQGLLGSNHRMNYGLEMLKKESPAVLVYLNNHLPEESFKNDFEILKKLNSGQNKKIASQAAMDLRRVGIGAQILKLLGVQKMNVHMTQTKNIKGLAGFGLEIEKIIQIQ